MSSGGPQDAGPARGWSRRQVLRAGAGLGLAGGLVGLGAFGGRLTASAWPGGIGSPPDMGPATLSLLGVGDTGGPSNGRGRWAPSRRVASAITAVHREQPCDGLLLLGDNFYPEGLAKARLAEQVRDCLVDPYRAFLELSPGSGEHLGVDPLCAACNAVPVYAVLGNHDYNTPESPGLQVDELPQLLPDWKMARRLVELHELGEGVSLILLQSTPWDASVQPLLADCLARSRGPFRILAAHHPMADPGNKYNPSYTRELHAVLAAADVPVQLFLSGHEHNLQLLQMPRPAPALHVIVGSGSYVRRVSDTRGRRLFGASERGFARIDRRRVGEREVLDVSVYEAESWPWPHPSPHLVARAWVDADGAVQARVRA